MLQSKIEVILFVAGKPLSIKKLAEVSGTKTKEVEAVIKVLTERYNNNESGVRLVQSGNEVQFMTSPDHAKLVRDFLKSDITGELTRPQLETLTVVAYRQPITKPELEQIRGVNCSLILRNLMMRGLVDCEESKEKLGFVYRVTHDFLKFLGIANVSELPEYEKLRTNEYLEQVLATEENKDNAQ
ncbi:MAG: Segregation and condensation protein B [Parcubacteria group bacterium GW2011_GWC2_39_14]|nr:MAG: Segregation and condensation protein B [Parcubacteria group bacterium GW2011_GWC2_39_14]